MFPSTEKDPARLDWAAHVSRRTKKNRAKNKSIQFSQRDGRLSLPNLGKAEPSRQQLRKSVDQHQHQSSQQGKMDGEKLEGFAERLQRELERTRQSLDVPDLPLKAYESAQTLDDGLNELPIKVDLAPEKYFI